MWAHPNLAPSPRLEARTPRQKLLPWLHHHPPGRVSGVAGVFRAEQTGPDNGAEAVRAHEEVGTLLAASEEGRHAALVLVEALHIGAESQRSLARLSHEQGLQVRPVDGGARSSDLLLQFGSGDAREHLPTPRAYFASGGGRATGSARLSCPSAFWALAASSNPAPTASS